VIDALEEKCAFLDTEKASVLNFCFRQVENLDILIETGQQPGRGTTGQLHPQNFHKHFQSAKNFF